MIKIYSCGQCGAPCYIDGQQLDAIPENYNPDDYEHTWCNNCAFEETRGCIQVTHEMAMDAGDLSLEGQWVQW